jgi:virginiamycin B lyase
VKTKIILTLAATLASAFAQTSAKPKRPGIKAVQVPFTSLRPSATFKLGGHPDWLAITPDAVWVANDQFKAVQRINPKTNKVVAKIDFPAEPCSGLAVGFGSLWVPLCGEPAALARVDLKTNLITATLPFGPADSEGGITASSDSIWLVTDKGGTLSRIDPETNTVRQKVPTEPGSANPLFSDGLIWITNSTQALGTITVVNASTGQMEFSVPTGSHLRFLTAGAGAIWVLDQGDGAILKVERIGAMRTVTHIPAGIPGTGGEICFDGKSIWATVFDIPLTRIDAKTNRVVRQWVGQGGDSVRFGHGSLWLTHYKKGLLWRIPLAQTRIRRAL